jgi:hypothetical protein
LEQRTWPHDWLAQVGRDTLRNRRSNFVRISGEECALDPEVRAIPALDSDLLPEDHPYVHRKRSLQNPAGVVVVLQAYCRLLR